LYRVPAREDVQDDFELCCCCLELFHAPLLAGMRVFLFEFFVDESDARDEVVRGRDTRVDELAPGTVDAQSVHEEVRGAIHLVVQSLLPCLPFALGEDLVGRCGLCGRSRARLCEDDRVSLFGVEAE
jgi:hypothetical protein